MVRLMQIKFIFFIWLSCRVVMVQQQSTEILSFCFYSLLYSSSNVTATHAKNQKASLRFVVHIFVIELIQYILRNSIPEFGAKIHKIIFVEICSGKISVLMVFVFTYTFTQPYRWYFSFRAMFQT